MSLNRNQEKRFFQNKKPLEHREIYRTLRTRILFNKKEVKTLCIVSNDIGDGKTQLAYSLAESYSKTGLKVLVIDGNLRNPELSLGMSLKETDFSKLLVEPDSIKKAIIKTNTENLFLLPTEKPIENSTELLNSKHLKNIINEANELFDFIIIDTLSLNEGIDAIILSKFSDGVIYITVDNKTNASKLKENKIIFDEAGIDIVGAVFQMGI